MPEQEIYTSTNPYSSLQSQGGGPDVARHVGWCTAHSAIWCKNMLDGGLPASTKPSALRAGVLQVKYRWDPAGGGQDFINLIENVDCHGAIAFWEIGRELAVTHMAGNPGVYHFSNEGHSMGVDTRSATSPYFYDNEKGLYGYDSIAELRQGIATRYASDDSLWRGILVTA